jgi:hypothetical protein
MDVDAHPPQSPATAGIDRRRRRAAAAQRARAREQLVTERDRQVLAFLAEQRLAVTPQIEVLLGVSQRVAQDRLRTLGRGGYLDRRRIFDGYPACARITGDGLAVIGSSLPVSRIDLACYQHDVGLGWLWLAAHAGRFGSLSEVLSERRLRSHDARAARSERAQGVGIGGVGPGGREQLHYPDLLLRTAGGRRVAVELELTSKSPHRLQGIMLGYAADARIDAVLYLVPDRALGERIAQAARRAGIGSLVRVQQLDGLPRGAPDHGRTLGRRRWHSRTAPATAGSKRATSEARR